MISDPVPAGVPLTSGAGAPDPWNENDVYRWTDAILKYACIEAPDKNPLHASEFALSETGQVLAKTYHDEQEKEKAISSKNSKYYILLETCLQKLVNLGVLIVGQLSDASDAETYRVYHRTDVLRNKVCPVIHREPDKLHDINSILNNR